MFLGESALLRPSLLDNEVHLLIKDFDLWFYNDIHRYLRLETEVPLARLNEAALTFLKITNKIISSFNF